MILACPVALGGDFRPCGAGGREGTETAYRHLAMASVLPCVQVSIAQAGAGAGQGTGAQFERVSARFIRGSKLAVCLLM